MTFEVQTNDIIEGIVIGVSSGIILSLVFLAKDITNKFVERREQIRYLSNLIAKSRDRIHDAKTEYFPEVKKEVTRAEFCKMYYDEMRKELEPVLKHRSSRLSYDEIKEVRKVFFTDLFPNAVLNEKGYEGMFKELESIKWLKLPSRTI